MPVIEVQGLTKRFGPVVAVDDLTFAIDPGSVVGFLGPNGAGKTTTLRMLLGLVEPSAGAATIHGRRYRDLEDPLRQVGAVLEASSSHPGRTARDHLRVHACAGGIALSRVDELLGLVGLADAAETPARFPSPPPRPWSPVSPGWPRWWRPARPFRPTSPERGVTTRVHLHLPQP